MFNPCCWLCHSLYRVSCTLRSSCQTAIHDIRATYYRPVCSQVLLFRLVKFLLLHVQTQIELSGSVVVVLGVPIGLRQTGNRSRAADSVRAAIQPGALRDRPPVLAALPFQHRKLSKHPAVFWGMFLFSQTPCCWRCICRAPQRDVSLQPHDIRVVGMVAPVRVVRR